MGALRPSEDHERRVRGALAGESARSAYLFFHREELAEWASIDVFLNETPRTLRGNIALAIDAPALGEARELRPLLSTLSRTARETLLEGYETPVILRLRLPDGAAGPEEAEMEYRFKIRIPGAALEAGSSAIVALAGAVVGAFEELLEHPSLRHHLRDR